MNEKRGASAFRSLSGGAPDFDHPLEMLLACHDRIEDRCGLLQRLIAHLDSDGCDAQAQQAAASVLRYFDTAGEHHHRDEEDDLFPLLVELDAGAAAPLVERLCADHALMRAAWQKLRPALAQIADGAAGELDGGDVDAFAALYRDHIAREEAQLIPLAQRILDEAKLRAIGAAMAGRRGVAH